MPRVLRAAIAPSTGAAECATPPRAACCPQGAVVAIDADARRISSR